MTKMTLACYSLIITSVLGLSAGTVHARSFDAPTTRPARVIFDKTDENGIQLKVTAAPFDLVAEWSKDKRFVPDKVTPPPKAEEYTFDVLEHGTRTTLGKVCRTYWDERCPPGVAMGGGPSEKFFQILDARFEGGKCFLLVMEDHETFLHMLPTKGASDPAVLLLPGELECHVLFPNGYDFDQALPNVEIETGSIRGRESDGTLAVELVGRSWDKSGSFTFTFSRCWKNGLPDFTRSWHKTSAPGTK